MTKRLFPASRGKASEDEFKETGISHLRENVPQSSDEGNRLTSTPTQGVSEKLLKNGKVSEDERKWNLPSAGKRPSFISRGKSLH